jgi:hypothetical protein
MFRMRSVLWISLLALSATLAGYQVFASSAPAPAQNAADCPATACTPSCDPSACPPECRAAD